ncbi:MAG: type II toxin-antitoxin system HicB family antitoxin [Phycisphaerales bacterium]
MDWKIVLEQDYESGDWAAWVPELPGCASAGTTRDEAIANIGEAIELYLQPDAT